MKRSKLPIALFCVDLIIASLLPLHALTPSEQADAFYQRGLEAEKREDFMAAANCYALTLRVNPGHVESLARMADLEKRNVFSAEARAKILTLPALGYHLTDSDPSIREAKFQETLALMNRLTGLEFVLEMEGEPIPSHWIQLGEVTVEQAMQKIAQYSRLAVSYDRNAIRIAPKSSLSEASPETREKLRFLKERLGAELASVAEPRRENLAKLGGSIDAEFATLSEAVKALPNDLAAINAERAKVGYAVRSKMAGDQPGSFTAGAEGWTLFDTKGAVTQPVVHNKTGYLDGKDLIQGSDYYFAAPQSFLDLVRTASTSDSLSFDFYTSAADVGIKDTLVLESPGMTLVLPVSNPPIREWKQFTYRFDPSEGWKIGTIGKIGKEPATADEIQQVLVSATKLYIRGEWKTGPDVARLDNVMITSNDPSVNPSTPGAISSPVTTKPSLTSVAPFAPDPPAATPAMLPAPVAQGAMGKPSLAPGQPNPETDFKGWLKTVQLKHGLGDGVIWSFEDGVVLHYSQKDPNPKVQRFEVLSIDAETRTVAWKQPGSEHSIRISNEFKKFEWKGKDKPFVPQPLPIEPRDPKIFGPSPIP